MDKNSGGFKILSRKLRIFWRKMENKHGDLKHEIENRFTGRTDCKQLSQTYSSHQCFFLFGENKENAFLKHIK